MSLPLHALLHVLQHTYFLLHQLLLSDCGCLLWIAVAALPQHIWLRIWPLLCPLFKHADTVIEFKDGLCHTQCPKHLLTPSLLSCSSQSSGSVVCEQKRIAYILRHNCRRAHAYIQGFRALTVNPHGYNLLLAHGDKLLLAHGDNPLLAHGDQLLLAHGDKLFLAHGDNPLLAHGKDPLLL